MRWILILGLLRPAPDPVRRAADLEFARGVEHWVADIRRDAPLPPIVTMMGSPRYVAREFASWCIRFGGERYLEPLVRATYHRDAEIRLRAQALIDRLFICPACQGSGWCRRCTKPYDLGCPCDSYNHCPTCNGGRDLRYEVEFVAYVGLDAEGNQIEATHYRPRRLFVWRRPTPTAAAKTE